MSLLELCAVVFTYNAMTFGNGPGMVPLLQGDLVDRRGVLSSEQLLYAFTIARVTPGQANTYVAAIGYMLHGLAGTVISLTALVLPALVLTVALTAAYGLLHRQAWLAELLPVTILPAALAFIVVAGVRLGRDVFRPSRELLLAAAAFAGAAVLHLSPVLLLLAGGVAGTVLFRPKKEDQA